MSRKSGFSSKYLAFSRSAMGAFVIGVLVLLASFTNYLAFNSYPVFTAEAGLSILFLVGISAIAALLYKISGSLPRTALICLLVIIAFDINYVSKYDLIIAAIAVLALRDYSLPVLGVVAVTVLGSNLLQFANIEDAAHAARPAGASGSEFSGPENRDLPVLLHIILDGHIGVEGITGKEPEENVIAEELKDYWTGSGFRLFGGAYAIHRRTVNSIPAILNNNQDPELFGDIQGLVLNRNRYFEYLADRGYRINVQQTDWIDYCGASGVYACREWKSADPRALMSVPYSAPQRSLVLLSQFLSLSKIAITASAVYDDIVNRAGTRWKVLPPLEIREKSYTSTLVAAEAFDRLVDDLRDARPGTAYFAHILLPHHPFALTNQCDFKGPFDWQVQVSSFASVRDRKLAYYDQIRCTNRKVAAALDALRSSAAGDNAIVIVHSDHGSRITDHEPFLENAGKYTDQDMVATYSTLFAVRAANIEAGYDSRRLPVHRLLAELTSTDFAAVEPDIAPDFRHRVILERSDWTPVSEGDLPDTWLNPPVH